MPALLPILGLLGCKAPPPAPDGLTDSLRQLLREFHADDDTVGAGLTGLMDWFDAAGEDLVGERADAYNVGAFQLGPLEPGDVARLPVEGAPDVAAAPGVVSLDEMECGLRRAQGLLVRPDQDVVFEDAWKSYDRAFDTDRAAFEDAAFDDVAAIREEIPEDGLASHEDALLVTTNQVEAADLGFTIAFDLALRIRHGTFTVQGEDTDAVLILSFMPHRAERDGGDDAIAQSWSIEADLPRDGKTLRVFGAWSELDSKWIAADAAQVLQVGVNKAQDTAEQMSGICAGEIDVPPE